MLRWMIAVCVVVFSLQASAVDVRVLMLSEQKALLSIDGKQRMVQEGSKTPEGVVLVSANQQRAVIEWQGERKTLQLNRQIASRFNGAEKSQVSIASNKSGHHFTPGRINGFPVDFMVDTGATLVSMNYLTAERLGIDYRAGRPVKIHTANGVADAFRVVLNRVAVGTIELNQIDGVVSTTSSPEVILLGNSYLGKVDLRVEGGVMFLQQK